MKREFFKTGKLAVSHPGVSLTEILIVLAISGVLAAMTVPMLLNQDKNKAGVRLIDDYVHHLSSVYQSIMLKHGDTPLNAEDADGNALYPDGIGSFLQDWETAATYSATPSPHLTYPSGIILWLDPEDTGNIPGNECKSAGGPNPYFPGTDNREWFILDVNGDTNSGDNCGGVGKDRVVLYVEDSTGRVLTAFQKCEDEVGNIPFGACPYPGGHEYVRSFYDIAKGH